MGFFILFQPEVPPYILEKIDGYLTQMSPFEVAEPLAYTYKSSEMSVSMIYAPRPWTIWNFWQAVGNQFPAQASHPQVNGVLVCCLPNPTTDPRPCPWLPNF